MRHYECECIQCGKKRQIAFDEVYPEIGEVFLFNCSSCACQTEHTRVLTKKAKAELQKKEKEEELRKSIIERCKEYGFQYRFLYQSVIVTTELADWGFDYHESRITLRHESTKKINWDTGNYAKTHVQFRDRKMSPLEVIDYIAKHDDWRGRQKE